MDFNGFHLSGACCKANVLWNCIEQVALKICLENLQGREALWGVGDVLCGTRSSVGVSKINPST